MAQLANIVLLLWGFRLCGSVIVETIFAEPGVRHPFGQAIIQSELPVVQLGSTSLPPALTMTNAAVVLLCVRIDPRM